MNQPRCVLLAALALAALLVGSATAAQTDLSLNLRYDDPNDMAAGGTWTLVAKTDEANGVSAVSAYLGGLSGMGGDIAFTTGIGHMGLVGSPPATTVMEFASGNVNAVYGQDMTLPVVGGVGELAGVTDCVVTVTSPQVEIDAAQTDGVDLAIELPNELSGAGEVAISAHPLEFDILAKKRGTRCLVPRTRS